MVRQTTSLFKHGQQCGSKIDPAAKRRMRLAIASLACCLMAVSAQAQQPPQQQPKQQQELRLQLQSINPAPAQAAPPAQVAPPAQAAPPAQVVPPAADAAPPSHRPGFLDALGRFFGDSKEAIDSQVRGTQDTLGTIGSQAKDAAGSVIAIPGTRVITGRQLCPPSSNGAPDCQQGADALCRGKGFQGGRNLDITSAQRCPARVYLESRPPKEGECRMETYVTRAVCQ